MRLVRQTRPPRGPLSLNRDSPLANGLLMWYPPNAYAWQGKLRSPFVTQTYVLPEKARGLHSAGSYSTDRGMVLSPDPSGQMGLVFDSSDRSAALRFTDSDMDAEWGSWAVWMNMTSDPGGTLTAFYASRVADVDYFQMRGYGANIRLHGQYNNNGFSYDPHSRASIIGEWHLYGLNFRAADSLIEYYIDGVYRSSDTYGAWGTHPPNNIVLGNNNINPNGAGWPGMFGDLMWWNRPLSAADWWKLWSPETRWDLHWTAERMIARFVMVPAGGTEYTKSLAGTLTSSGALSRQTNKGLAGTLTTAGAVVKRTAKGLAGTLTSSGALSAIRLYVKSLAGTFTSSGALSRQTNKGLAGTLTTAGAVVKRTAKGLAGTLTSSGTVSAIRLYIKSLAGTFTSSGSLSRQTNKSLTGTLTTSGAITKRISKALSGAMSWVGALATLVSNLVYGGSVALTITSEGSADLGISLEGSATLEIDVE